MRKDYIQTNVIVCWGVGQDSTGLIIGMYERGLRPWKIVFADVGNERAETYVFFAIFCEWLDKVGFPKPEVVRYRVKNFKHWPHYFNLLENCLTNVTLPALAYGGKSCSKKWKIDAINAYLNALPECREVWARGEKLEKAIGFDDSPHEHDRACRGTGAFDVSAEQRKEKHRYTIRFPLQEWKWQRADCVAAIERQGLPVPPKSSCFFCPGMKPWEVDTLSERELKICIVLEARVIERNYRKALDKAYEDVFKRKGSKPSIHDLWQRGARGKALVGWQRGKMLLPGHQGPVLMRCEGLWRERVKGQRGSFAKPGSWAQYIKERGLLPAAEVDRIWDTTPRNLFTRADFDRIGVKTWKEWLDWILEPQGAPELAPQEVTA